MGGGWKGWRWTRKWSRKEVRCLWSSLFQTLLTHSQGFYSRAVQLSIHFESNKETKEKKGKPNRIYSHTAAVAAAHPARCWTSRKYQEITKGTVIYIEDFVRQLSQLNFCVCYYSFVAPGPGSGSRSRCWNIVIPYGFGELKIILIYVFSFRKSMGKRIVHCMTY